MLLTGDARGDHIEDGLRSAKLLKQGKLHVNLYKVQHHGSDRNVEASFFDRITADTYVISANGRYGNPDYETLEWIMKAARKAKRKIAIVVTNATPTTRKLVKEYNEARYGYTLTIKPANEHAIAVQVA